MLKTTSGTKLIIDPTDYPRSSWYRGSEGLKKKGVVTDFTPEMMKEFRKCKDDIEHFCEKYVWITDVDKGMVKFHARDYQKRFWKEIIDNRFIISKMGRQAGKTTSIVGYLLYYAIFFGHKKNIGIAAQNVKQAREIVHRFKQAYEGLPSWMQVGVTEWQKGGVELGNGCRIFASSSNGDALRGQSLALLILDEFAHIRGDKEFMEATWPVVSSGKKTKIIIISTPNGIGNSFYELWAKAEKKINSFVTFSVKWNEIPGRNEKWRAKMIGDIGKRKFAQEYAAEFHGSSNTLVDSDVLFDMEKNLEEPIKTEQNDQVKIFRQPEEGHSYALTADVARGYGGDNSTFSIWDTSKTPYEQVLSFSDNQTSTQVLPYLIYTYAQRYNEAFVAVERNDAGGEVANILFYEIEYENMYTDTDPSGIKPGVWTEKKLKRSACSSLRDMLDSQNIIIRDEAMLNELKIFEGNKAGQYNAKPGADNYDDRVQNAWMFCAVLDSKIYQYYKEDLNSTAKTVHGKTIEKLLEQMGPIGSMGGKQMTEAQMENLRRKMMGEGSTGMEFTLG